MALYLALPGDTDAQLIHRAIPEAAQILELGCGVGRVTRPLARLGHTVTGVDNSPEMLGAFECPTGIETVLADIESLNLGRKFRVVVLASHMINDEAGGAYLRAAARHVTEGGMVVVQRHEPGWVDTAQPTDIEQHEVGFHLTAVTHPEPGALSATMVYTVAGITYRQPFVALEVDDERLAHLAHEAGLEVDGYVHGNPAWVELIPRLA